MDFKVNVNTQVKVKLTDVGIAILKERHDELNRKIRLNGGKGIGEFELRLDEDGYYRTQFWTLMNVFGDAVNIGKLSPFELDIIVTNGKVE